MVVAGYLFEILRAQIARDQDDKLAIWSGNAEAGP
jgi:hypothetical protein